MCGRYYSRRQKQEIAEALRAREVTDERLPPNFNIAPSTHQAIVRQSRDIGDRELVLARWGLVPFFAKSLAAFKGFSTINARAESVASSATWREPFRKRRCLVYADGFYEWKQLAHKIGEPTAGTFSATSSNEPVTATRRRSTPSAATKQPYAITITNGEPLVFAGLWDAWRDPADGSWLQSFAIVTTEANEIMSAVHTRMPVILPRSTWDEWLDRDSDPARPPLHLLRPFDSGDMQIEPCNPAVGNVRNNGP